MHLASTLLRLTLATCLLLATFAQPARAVTLIRDPDIEYALGQLAEPVLHAAGLNPAQTRILLVDHRSLNAFVIDGQVIFIHTGLLNRLQTAAQLQAVIAHEAAHIANGHLSRRMSNLQNSRTAAGFGMALAVIVAAATGEADAAAGIAAGSASSAQRFFFAHTRAEENAADQSSIRYLLRAGIDPAAAVEVLELFRGQEALMTSRQDPYARTHPLTADRLRSLRSLIAANPGTPGDSATAEYWFARAQGKLSAFTQSPSWTLRQIRTDTSQIGLMRRAIAEHRQSNAQGALSAMSRLLAERPNDPFLHELHGQILLESRQFPAAVQAYGRAAELAPNDALILGGLGRALLTLDTADANARAVRSLERARALDFRDGRVLRDLGLAYARTGQPGLASLATAERYALAGRSEDARLHATRAADQLPRGSAPWQRAQDVLVTVGN